MIAFISSAQQISDTKVRLLCGDSFKSWALYDQSPEGIGTCSSSSDISRDNTYTFFADGKFTFDHGQITDDDDCEGEHCCGDIINVTGQWYFANDGRGIVIKSKFETGNPDNTIAITLFSGSVESLDEDIFRFKIENPKTGLVHIFELHRK